MWPGRYDLTPLANVWTVRGFDEAYTAPHHGFRDADDYYYRASALRVVDEVRVPALIIASDNDPFVPAEQFARPEVAGNPHVTVVITRDGGHCAFVAESPDGYDGYWAEQTRDRASSASSIAATSRRNERASAGAGCARCQSFSRIDANSGPFPSSSCLK